MLSKIGLLIFSLGVALVPWFESLNQWNDAMTTGNIGALIGIVCGVGLAWMGQSPRKPKV